MPRDEHGHLTAGRISPTRQVPRDIERPEYVGHVEPHEHGFGDTYDAAEIARIRDAGRIASRAIDAVGAAIRPGVTTDELDRIGHEYLIANGAYPSTLGYRGYPKSLCSSVNEVICHGIPDDTVLQDGDIVNIDITAYKDGMHGDTNRTFVVGQGSPEVLDLVARTEEAMNRGIRAVAPGRQVNVIGRAIESYAKRFGYGVVRDYTGHGVGRTFHSGLIIPHYDAPQYDTVIEPGMVFTIEPGLYFKSDDLLVPAEYRGIGVRIEDNILVTESGAENLSIGIPRTADDVEAWLAD